MKHVTIVVFPLLVFALLSMAPTALTGQTFSVAAASAETSGEPTDWIPVIIDVTNISGKPLTLRVEIIDRSGLPEDWDTQICFFQNCFPPGTSMHEGDMATDFKEPLDITFITSSTPASGTVRVRVTNVDDEDENVELTFTAVTGTTSASTAPLANELRLSQNYPNPFALNTNSSTVISYRTPESGMTTLKVYNLLGREVRTLVNEVRPAGRTMVTWNGRDNTGRMVPAGIYVYKLTTNTQSVSRRMMLTR
ncbi:MAG: T9SS type A sorting domain-containing protein [Bacteroidetes bacterium]|nr:T9SS type A sorting domain-containing protein [Bacteroidota bacterium]